MELCAYRIQSRPDTDSAAQHLSKGAIAGIAVACVAAVVAVALVIVFVVARMRARAAADGAVRPVNSPIWIVTCPECEQTPYRAFNDNSAPVFK